MTINTSTDGVVTTDRPERYGQQPVSHLGRRNGDGLGRFPPRQSGIAATICSWVKGMLRTRTPMAS